MRCSRRWAIEKTLIAPRHAPPSAGVVALGLAAVAVLDGGGGLLFGSGGGLFLGEPVRHFGRGLPPACAVIAHGACP